MKEVQQGTELHLICATNGEAGANPDHEPNLGSYRIREWQIAAKALGATKCYALGYPDGGLCCNLYHDIAHKILTIITDVCRQQTQPVALKLLTLDTNGVTGHLDHIAISYITTFVFHKLKTAPPHNAHVQELAYFCLSKHQAPAADESYFVYRPEGRNEHYITRQEKISDELIERKLTVARLHASQRQDANVLLHCPHSYH